jgi:dihydroorotase
MSPRLILRGGELIDPSQGTEGERTVVIEGGKVAALPAGAFAPAPGDRVMDVAGLWVVPGLIDLHSHLREPGEEHKETLESGCRAGAAGGFTTLLAMANTRPPADTAARVRWVREKARSLGSIDIQTVGTVTLGLDGQTLTDAEGLADAGAVALSDDGRPIQSPLMMRRALELARDAGLPILAHEEELLLVGRGCMHEGSAATRLGLAGVPGAAEEVMVRRDLALVELTGGRLHLQHVSTEGSVRALREAKARGLQVTGEASPHHFSLTDSALLDARYDPDFKMNPPLRSERDRAAVRAGLADGTLDAIATDHAPHGPIEKETVFEAAANGIIGLETAFALGLALVREGDLPRRRLIELFTTGPARVIPAFRDLGSLEVGATANLTVIDPARRWTVDLERLRSKSRNTPFKGKELTGRVVLTLVRGEVVFSEGLGGDRG